MNARFRMISYSEIVPAERAGAEMKDSARNLRDEHSLERVCVSCCSIVSDSLRRKLSDDH